MQCKSAFLLLIALLAAAGLCAQADLSLTDFNARHLQQQRTAMLVLGGWAVGNIGAGLYLRSQREGTDRYFHEMNALWNTVNLGIATFAYLSIRHTDPAALSLYSSLEEHYSFQKILLLNTGLDVGYLLGGAWLIERSRRPDVNSDRLKGYGRSILLQGSFLFAFDLVNYFISAAHTDQLQLFLPQNSPGVGFLYQF